MASGRTASAQQITLQAPTKGTRITGTRSDDEIAGTAFSDKIYGRNGNDVITGGAGGDVIEGGNGADRFVYTAATDSPYTATAVSTGRGGSTTSSWDVIADFEPGVDKIDLTALSAALLAAGQPMLQWSPLATTDAEAGLRNPSRANAVWTNGTFVYADTNGDGGADLKIQAAGAGPGDLLGVNQAPKDEDETAQLASPEASLAGNLLANAFDPDGQSLAVALPAGSPTETSGLNGFMLQVTGTYGTLHINTSTGAYLYVLDPLQPVPPGSTATETFSYLVTDGNGGTNTSMLTIGIAGVDGPGFNDVANLIEGDTIADVSASGKLVIAGQDLTFEASLIEGNYGNLQIETDGSWTFTAHTAFDEFADKERFFDEFAVTSTNGGTYTITINITGTDDLTKITPTTATLVADSAGATTTGDVSFTDPDNPFAAIIAEEGITGEFGTFSIDPAGSWTYQLASALSFESTESLFETFEISAEDGATSTVTIELVPPPPPGAATEALVFSTQLQSDDLDIATLVTDAGAPDLELGQLLAVRFGSNVSEAARDNGGTLREAAPEYAATEAPPTDIATSFALQTLDTIFDQAAGVGTA